MRSELQSHDYLLDRRKRLREASHVFGLDFVEVCRRERHDAERATLRLHFLGRRPVWLTEHEHVALRDKGSGRRLAVKLVASDRKHGPDSSVEIEVAEPVCRDVDYTLTLDVPDAARPALDPFFACLTFRFDPSRPAEVDCVPPPAASAALAAAPEINYLVKDYATFRQLMLDRLSVTMPDWQERCPADIGVMLVEILAYAADHLSYYQDAVATEAYLGTARLRQSLRRHARLVDYRMHEGCNARVWVHVDVVGKLQLSNAQDLFFVSLPASSSSAAAQPLPPAGVEELMGRNPRCQVFEPVVSKSFTLWESHNKCRLHDWGGATPCLPAGATSAFLVNQPDSGGGAGASRSQQPNAADRERPDEYDWLKFKRGDVVIFEELLSPTTGCPADANPVHRHAVRITSVDYEQQDDLHKQGDEFSSLPLVKITWDEADALPFTLWISKPPNAQWNGSEGGPLSVARGNNLLCDHGRRVSEENVDLSKAWEDPPGNQNANYPAAGIKAVLGDANLTFSAPLPVSGAPASVQLRQDPRRATPQLVLQARSCHRPLVGQYSILELSDLRRVAKRLLEQLAADYGTAAKPALECSARHARQVRQACGCHEQPAAAQPLVDLAQFRNAIRDDLRDVWLPRYDLLDSGPDDAHFVVEMSDERQAMLRFGQRGFGRAPDLAADAGDAEMLADYRTGNGTAGNVPAESIRRFGSYGSPYPEILSVRNPLAAVGGVDAESATEVRLFAPHAIRTQLQRAVTAGDYERIAMREFGGELQRVKATLLWTGHEFEVLVAVDPRGGEVAGHELLDAIRATLHRYRRIGHAVRVRAAERVVPTLALTVCVGRHVIKEQVRNDLDRLFSNQVFPDGSLAFFHPDRLTFGDGIYVSQIVAAAARVPGVVHVEVTALHRSDEGPATELEDGVLPLRPQEIVRFDNDRSRPEFGTLRRPIKGGR